MRPIWYFVGLILSINGIIIFGTGLYLLYNPPAVKTVLFDTHPNIWWGILMTIFGVVFTLLNMNKRVE
ncbi:MAG: hypothetical protein HYV28_03510 [Ignavibacteriales bacterium]|nr:hypothetical protein [Ignavibacteriales bacterium]